jgi:hypothetical protein
VIITLTRAEEAELGHKDGSVATQLILKEHNQNMSGQERYNQPFKRVAPAGGDRRVNAAADSSYVEDAKIAELLKNQQMLEERDRLLEEQIRKSQHHAETSQNQASMMLEQNRELTSAMQKSSATAKAAMEAAAEISKQQQQNCDELQRPVLQQQQMVPQPVGPDQGVPPQQGVAAVAAQLPEHAKVKKFIDGVVQKNVTIVTKAQKEINNASAAKAGLEELTFDLNKPNTPLPHGVLNKAKSLHNPKLKVTSEMAEDETCTAALELLQLEVDKKLRAVPKEIVTQGIRVRTQIVDFYEKVKSENISDGKVRTAVREIMTDTTIPATLQTQMIEAVSESFG